MLYNAIERLFLLFTSSDRAVAIAGDLAEEQELRGRAWFWLHVVGVTLALWRNAVTEAPLRVLGLILAGSSLLTASALGGAAAVFLFPQSMNSLVGWISLPFFLWGGAFGTGAVLVILAPCRGMAACATLAVAGGALLVEVGGAAVWSGPSNADFVLFWFCTTGLLAALPLLAGAAVARRLIVCPVVSQEQHR